MQLLYKKRLSFLAALFFWLLVPLLAWQGAKIAMMILYLIIPSSASALAWHHYKEYQASLPPDELLDEGELQARNFKRGLKLAMISILAAFVAMILFALLLLSFVSLMGKMRGA
jgi:hypothetical protein